MKTGFWGWISYLSVIFVLFVANFLWFELIPPANGLTGAKMAKTLKTGYFLPFWVIFRVKKSIICLKEAILDRQTASGGSGGKGLAKGAGDGIQQRGPPQGCDGTFLQQTGDADHAI